jgi:hypothetical protein
MDSIRFNDPLTACFYFRSDVMMRLFFISKSFKFQHQAFQFSLLPPAAAGRGRRCEDTSPFRLWSPPETATPAKGCRTLAFAQNWNALIQRDIGGEAVSFA